MQSLYLTKKIEQIKRECICKGRVSFCTLCDKAIKLEMMKEKANIPIKYRQFTFDDVTYKAVQNQKQSILKYIENLDDNRMNGFGLFLYGGKGLAKTVLASLVLMEVLKKGYNAYFSSLDDYFKHVCEFNTTMITKIESCDFIAIDSLGNEFLPNSGSMQTVLAKLFKARTDQLFPIIVTSSFPPAVLDLKFGFSISSILKEQFVQIEFKGIDFREGK